MEEVNDRELRVAFGLKNCSRFPKSAARNDDGNRREWWWKKPAKPREIGGMLYFVSLIVKMLCPRSTCVKKQRYEGCPAAMQWSNLENVGMVVRASGGPSAKLGYCSTFQHLTTHSHSHTPNNTTVFLRPVPHGFNCCGVQGVGARRHSAAPQPWREER
jgi:hypothetical protein